MRDGFVPDHIARHIDRVAQAHLCRQAGISFDPTRRMRAKRTRMARMKATPTAMRVLAYDLSDSNVGVWRLQWSEDKKFWILIAINPAKSTGVPRMKIFSDTSIRLNRMLAPGSPMESRLIGMAEKAIGDVVEKYNYEADPHIRRQASAVIVGDIFYSSWGYDQTNVEFYQVVKTTPKMVALRPIEKKVVNKRGEPSEAVMPEANKFSGPPIRKKLGEYNGKALVRLTNYSSAYQWDGKPKWQTAWGYGH